MTNILAGATVLEMAEGTSVTTLLREFSAGDKSALDRLVPLVYGELRRVADGCLRREPTGHTLQPTALVHEAYERMVGQAAPECRDRSHFLAIAARVMRQILTDHARGKYADKRGGRQERFTIDEARDAPLERPAVMIRVDDALGALENLDPRKARLIEMRFFGGLTAEESAEVLDLPVQVVRRELRVAQAWLQRELGASE
jgi:RNA polymerase sigma-70 factor, ECF subfamily